jgi:hypothetical protein
MRQAAQLNRSCLKACTIGNTTELIANNPKFLFGDNYNLFLIKR